MHKCFQLTLDPKAQLIHPLIPRLPSRGGSDPRPTAQESSCGLPQVVQCELLPAQPGQAEPMSFAISAQVIKNKGGEGQPDTFVDGDLPVPTAPAFLLGTHFRRGKAARLKIQGKHRK